MSLLHYLAFPRHAKQSVGVPDIRPDHAMCTGLSGTRRQDTCISPIHLKIISCVQTNCTDGFVDMGRLASGLGVVVTDWHTCTLLRTNLLVYM